MPYSTLDDIKKLIPEEAIIQLADDEGAGVVDETKVAEAIAQADSEIDTYCGGRYPVPFITAPDIIKKISVDIAIYNLYSRKLEEIPKTRAERYNNAMKTLVRISEGKVQLVEADGDAVVDEGGPAASKTTDDRVFSDDKLGNY